MLHTYEQHSQRKLAASILTIIVIAGAVLFTDHLKAEHTATDMVSTQPSSHTTAVATGTSPTQAVDTSASSAPTTAASGLRDGTYTAGSNYYVPDGTESIGVTVAISNGIVTSASVKNSEGDRDSASFQEDFASSYKQYVVGKKICGLRLKVVAGASDTTQGFNDALRQITTKAQV